MPLGHPHNGRSLVHLRLPDVHKGGQISTSYNVGIPAYQASAYLPRKPVAKRVIDELSILVHASRSIAQATTLEEIKSIRDKAEAARQYAKSAALDLQIQNLAAEYK